MTGGVAIPEYPGDHFNYVFSKILMAGRANGLQVIDGPFLKVRELDSLREFSQRTRVLGYDGKWALTPDQVAVLNEVYSPTQEQFDRAWDILDAYRKATEEDRSGAVMFGDEMIDEASRKMATKFVVRRGERAGPHPVGGLEHRPGGRGSPRQPQPDLQNVNSRCHSSSTRVVAVHLDRAERRPVVRVSSRSEAVPVTTGCRRRWCCVPDGGRVPRRSVRTPSVTDHSRRCVGCTAGTASVPSPRRCGRAR